jgi:hypothetical protein
MTRLGSELSPRCSPLPSLVRTLLLGAHWLGALPLAAVLLGSVLLPRAALAAGEPRVTSSTTRIELGTDGSAIVRHELMLEVRGAPLAALTLRGVDEDAVPLPGATVTPLAEAGGAARAVELRADGDQLELTMPQRQGLRGASFLVRLGYSTRLFERGALTALPDGTHSLLRWTGPRFDDGVDSVTLVLKTPAAGLAPEVAARDDADPAYGIVMSTLRRSRDADELELVRAHVARGEAMTWEVVLDRSLFAAAPELDTAAVPTPTPTRVEPAPSPPVVIQPAVRSVRGARQRGSVGFSIWLGAGLLYALVVRLKAWSVTQGARARDALPRPWIPWGPNARALGAGGSFAAAAGLAAAGQPPLVCASWLLLAMAFAAHRKPDDVPYLRGPGDWQPLEASALTPLESPSLPGAWLDAGTLRGALLLAASFGGVIYCAARSFATSPYTGACMLLGGAALFPIFCTGRARELPLDTLQYSRRFLGEATRCLARDASLVVKPIGRVAAADAQLDELRLAITPARAVPGLLGVELGLEPRHAGVGPRPVIVVRAAEGSECQRRLPRGLTWTRGRSAEERACLVRPKLPNLAHSVALLHELFELLLAPAAAEAPVKKATRSEGNELSTQKAGTRSSPAHAT